MNSKAIERTYLYMIAMIFFSWFLGWLTHSLFMEIINNTLSYYQIPIMILQIFWIVLFTKWFRSDVISVLKNAS